MNVARFLCGMINVTNAQLLIRYFEKRSVKLY